MPSTLVGYMACMVAVVCFGSNFIFAKKVDIGDGVFFQFIMCCAIFLTSLPVLWARSIPAFHNFAMLGDY